MPEKNLVQLVQGFIAQQKEAHWDFKEKHPSNRGELLHDILCLANMEHGGRRYLIFGVTDSFDIIGCSGNEPRRSQADIIDLLRGNQGKFALDRYPSVMLSTIVLNGLEVDVLTIEDLPHKPYYTTEKIDCVRAHHIYSRTMDTNTPRDSEASPHDIERMWRERFGLNLSAYEKVKRLLVELENWEWGSVASPNASWFHKVFPEYTIVVEDAEEIVDCNQEWTRGEISQTNNHAAYYVIYFHQTELTRLLYISFDDGKKGMVAPQWEPRNHGRLYYYTKESLLHALQGFHAHVYDNDHSEGLRIGAMAGPNSSQTIIPFGRNTVSIPVATKDEVDEFIGDQERKCWEMPITNAHPEKQYRTFLKNQFDFEKWLAER